MVRAVYDAGSRATPASPSWGLAGAVDAPQVVQSVLVRIAYEYKPTRLTQGGTVATPAWDIAAQLMISIASADLVAQLPPSPRHASEWCHCAERVVCLRTVLLMPGTAPGTTPG